MASAETLANTATMESVVVSADRAIMATALREAHLKHKTQKAQNAEAIPQKEDVATAESVAVSVDLAISESAGLILQTAGVKVAHMASVVALAGHAITATTQRALQLKHKTQKVLSAGPIHAKGQSVVAILQREEVATESAEASADRAEMETGETPAEVLAIESLASVAENLSIGVDVLTQVPTSPSHRLKASAA